jgi:hypothetical protein
MSINSIASVQSLITKRNVVVTLPAVIATITNTQAPAPFQPGFYLTAATSVKNSSNNQISACSCIVSNQTSPYTFMNGTYYLLTSSTASSVIGSNLFLTFYGDSVPDAFQGPANYNSTGAYAGTVTTNVSGSSISGEWIQIQLPYTLYVTTYSVNANINGGPSWNYMFPKSFYLCGSNDGTNWSTVDNRSGLTCNSTGLNSFTAPTQYTGYKYFRLIGQQIGVGTSQGYRMTVCVGLRGTYRG